MSSWTPQDWGIFFGGLGLLITTAVIPLLQILMNRKINRNDVKATVARAELVAEMKVVKHQTNDITSQLAATKLAQGTAEGHAAGMIEGAAQEKANPS